MNHHVEGLQSAMTRFERSASVPMGLRGWSGVAVFLARSVYA